MYVLIEFVWSASLQSNLQEIQFFRPLVLVMANPFLCFPWSSQHLQGLSTHPQNQNTSSGTSHGLWQRITCVRHKPNIVSNKQSTWQHVSSLFTFLWTEHFISLFTIAFIFFLHIDLQHIHKSNVEPLLFSYRCGHLTVYTLTYLVWCDSFYSITLH